MTAAAPWSVKGIDPRARELAKDLARRSGMTLGEWLNHVILDDDVPEDVASEADIQTLARRAPEIPRTRPTAPKASTADDFQHLARALDHLTRRIEAAETRTGLAIAGIEHSVRQAIGRIETAEHQGQAIAARLEGLAASRPNVLVGPRSSETVRAVYGDGAGRAEGARDPVEPPLGQMVAQHSQRVALAEDRTAEALAALRGSLAALDDRLSAVEGAAPTASLDRRFETLAAELGARVEAARADAVARLQASTSGDLEKRLAEMAENVRAAERRSAHAVERMGREVLSLAEALNRRLLAAEQQGARAVDQVGGEIVRIGAVVESRLARSEQVHADALARLGAEIGRVTEQLTERVVQSERRAAQAIDDVGDQVVRATERLGHRHEKLAGDLTERLRESEARTAERFEQARQDLNASLSGARDRLAGVVAASTGRSSTPEAYPGAATFSAGSERQGSPTPAPRMSAEDFAPLAETAGDAFFDEADAEPTGAMPPQLSTREVIERARRTARAETAGAPGATVAGERRASSRPGSRRVFGGLHFRASARPPSTWQTALMLAGGAAFLSVAGAGVVLMEGSTGAASSQVAMNTPQEAPAARAAVALASPPIEPSPPVSATVDSVDGAPGADPADPQQAADYAAIVRDVESSRPGGLSRLRALAEGGYGPAQLYLVKLYETGAFGVVKNPAEGRRWLLRAAESGEPVAMHNLALDYFRGDGGPQDLTAAARWFRKAADAGNLDSQYNLGLLYETGSGVERDLAQAYLWFSVAAAGGDAQARANAAALQPKLPPEKVAAGDRAAVALRAKHAPSPDPPAAHHRTVDMAQRILGRLGYYKTGQGAGSPEFKLAVSNFQRDHDLPPTGELDRETVSQLSVFTR